MAGEDYLHIDDTIRFDSCDPDRVMEVPLSIIHDHVDEPAETFTVNLEREPDYGTNLQFQMNYQSATVTILAHD